jgi:hypothetical protein
VVLSGTDYVISSDKAPSLVLPVRRCASTTAAERSDWPCPLLPRLEKYKDELQEKDHGRLTCLSSEIGYSFFAGDVINQDDYMAGVLAFAILTQRTEMVKALMDIGVDLKQIVASKKCTNL